MILKSLNKYISLLIITLSFSTLYGENEIDIWNKKKQEAIENNKKEEINFESTINQKAFKDVPNSQNIEIENEILKKSEDVKIFGIYDPADNNFDLNMWSTSDADNVRSIIKRINKINLSNTSKNIFEKTLFSFAYPPRGMDEKEFINYKIDWMIDKKRTKLIEKFLEQNNEFHNKKKIIQYLVDENIAKANIKEGCKKIGFIDKNIKDSYLEKFKIYCLVFDNKKNEAQLLYDILNEQKKSDKFFDDKIKYLLGITQNTSNKVREDNLLNFYLSSITIKDFSFEPTNKTKKEIWEYLNAANLIKFEDIDNKEKLRNLENAANKGQFNKKNIFNIYKKIPFDINTLINAENLYSNLDGTDSRALIYQKFLLSENSKEKIKYLFILKDLFKKDNLAEVYTKFLSENLKEIKKDEIPESYKEIVAENIKTDEEFQLGKIKYDDKILHQSRLLKYLSQVENQKKVQKDFDKILKKIKKNRKYFFSAKDLALIETFQNDGLKIPEGFKYQELKKKYEIPPNLLQLAKNNETAFLTLKIVEIIGEDEPYQLDPETIYFIVHLLNQNNLKKLRNEILLSALPQRI